MSNNLAAMKVADQLFARIFDQRQFTRGEIEFLTKEFGHRVNIEENLDRILKIDQNVCVVVDKCENELVCPSEEFKKSLSGKIDQVQQRAERIMRIEDDQRKKEEKLLSELRLERQKVRQNIDETMKHEMDTLLEAEKSEELKMERKFRAFEENLRFNK